MKINFNAYYHRPFALAVAFHMMLLIFLLFRWHFSETVKTAAPSAEIIQATLISTTPLIRPTHSVPAEEKKIEPPIQEVIPNYQPTIQKMPKVPAVKKAPIQTPKSIQEPVLTTTSQNEQKITVEKKQAAKKEADKEAFEKKQIEKKQKQLQTEMENQLETEQKQQQIKKTEKQQKEIEQLLQKDLADLSAKKNTVKNTASVKQTSAGSSLDNQEIDRYKGLIIAAISHRWIVPESLKKGLVCHLRVRVAPGGMVMSVKQIKSSGDLALDHSAESAVYKASPLPVPKDSALFDTFREFNLVVKPEGILAE